MKQPMQLCPAHEHRAQFALDALQQKYKLLPSAPSAVDSEGWNKYSQPGQSAEQERHHPECNNSEHVPMEEWRIKL
jgi:hypothetical protein